MAAPLLAFAAAGWVALAPARLRGLAAAAVVLAAVSPWLAYPRIDNWVCWKESQVNSDARRAWTRDAAAFFQSNFRTGDGVLAGFGDQTGIFLEAGIPLRRTLHDGNGVEWLASTIRPDVFLREQWALAIAGDEVSRAMARAGRSGARYECVKLIALKGAPAVGIYRRVP
jgi:hypothetical protein